MAGPDVFPDPCPGTYKYLEVQYECVPYSTYIPPGPNPFPLQRIWDLSPGSAESTIADSATCVENANLAVWKSACLSRRRGCVSDLNAVVVPDTSRPKCVIPLALLASFIGCEMSVTH